MALPPISPRTESSASSPRKELKASVFPIEGDGGLFDFPNTLRNLVFPHQMHTVDGFSMFFSWYASREILLNDQRSFLGIEGPPPMMEIGGLHHFEIVSQNTVL